MTLSYLDALILGIVEGLTEFLPVSSTGHLTITEKLLGLTVDDPGVTAYTAVIQLGAIVATLLYFGKDIVRLLVAWVSRPGECRGPDPPRLPAGLGRHRRVDPGGHRRLRGQGPDQRRPAQPLGRRRRPHRLECRDVARREPPRDAHRQGVRSAARDRSPSRTGWSSAWSSARRWSPGCPGRARPSRPGCSAVSTG